MSSPQEAEAGNICVTIAAPSVNEALAEAARAHELGADLVEYRLDAMDRSAIDVVRMVKASPLPAIVTFRLRADGGRRDEDGSVRLGLLRRSLWAGAAYVDIEHGREAPLAEEAAGRLVVSVHDMRGTPANIGATARAIASGPATVVKVATTANGIADTFVHYEILATATKPTVAFAMGAAGASSRVLSLAFGAAWTYATNDEAAAAAPGQIGLARMIGEFGARDAVPGAPFYGVIGHPIAHSMSPTMHNASLRKAGLPGVYCAFDVEADAAGFVRRIFALGCRGLSVTVPHKIDVMKACDRIEPAAERIGAVNTVYLDGSALVGTNTDFYGARSAIALAAGGIEALERRTAIVVGAGGASRAIVFGLADAGASVSVTDVVEEKARDLARASGAVHVPHAALDVGAFDIVANASPVGMHPNVDACPVDVTQLRAGQIVFDAVYNPRETKLLREARARACRVAEGVEMFVAQGAKQFELFTGREAPVDTMRQVVLARLGG